MEDLRQRLREGATYHSVAQASVDDERGGRYATPGSKQTVIGASPIAYPTQPEGSPWRCDPCPTEPPLGYSVDEIEPLGEMFERAAPASVVAPVGAGVCDGPSTDTGRSVARFRRRA